MPEKPIEKMDIPVATQEGEVFDLGDIYEGMHVKKRILKKFAQDGIKIPDVIKEEIERHLKICPPDPETGRSSCGQIYLDHQNEGRKLPFE